MAQVCDLCGKGPRTGNNVSHANNKTRRRWNVNLRSVRSVVGGTHKRVRACTSCIRAGKVVKAARGGAINRGKAAAAASKKAS